MNQIVRRYLSKIIFITSICLGMSPAQLSAAGSKSLKTAFDQMLRPELSTSEIYRVDTLTVTQTDFTLKLSHGYLVFLRPVTIDSETVTYGAMFLDDPITPGEALFQFRPPLTMEQEQIRRFLKTDSLNRKCPSALLLFNQSMDERLKAGLEKTTLPKFKVLPKMTLKERWSPLVIKEDYGVPFATLKNLVAPRSKPFLAVSVPGDHAGDLVYMFDPYQREEVSLSKKYREMIVDWFLETICQYSVYADTTFERLNGIDRDEIKALHYDLNGSIDWGGEYTGSAALRFVSEIARTQLLELWLHEKLRVDSIIDPSGRKVEFVRWKKEKNKNQALYVMLDQPLTVGDTTTLAFYYHGEIARAQVGVFLVTAGGSWYPRYGYRINTTFDMTFESPGQYAFIATGQRVDSQIIGNVLRTRWRMANPAGWATFNLGTLTKYAYPLDGTGALDIYFNEEHHRAMAARNVKRPLTLDIASDTTDALRDWKAESVNPDEYAEGLGIAGRDMQKQVAEDLDASYSLYTSLFGAVPYRHLVATDLTDSTASYAYPGLVALSYKTFFTTDQFGFQRMHRAHEAAHQWWGVGTRWETYHDQWLSEGFASYSALLYIQRAMGNDRMLYWLDRDRKDIATLNKYFLKDRQQAGPLILGYRTSTTQSPDDYDLIIYKKGAYILHMLRGILLDLNTYSDSAFYSMMREFHTLYRDRFANTRDFKALAEKYVGGDLTWFFNEWVYGNVIPTYEFRYTVDQDSTGRYLAHCHVDQREVPADFKMIVPLEIQFRAGGSAWIRQWIDKPSCDFTIPIEGAPKAIIFNPMYFVLAEVKQ
ncbi:MAG: hypothetical protein HY851_12070 [candidate division Zixibacteria bacterium]|nr:hypothetical protein [candidate division Zixibacteria bacterium]